MEKTEKSFNPSDCLEINNLENKNPSFFLQDSSTSSIPLWRGPGGCYILQKLCVHTLEPTIKKPNHHCGFVKPRWSFTNHQCGFAKPHWWLTNTSKTFKVCPKEKEGLYAVPRKYSSPIVKKRLILPDGNFTKKPDEMRFSSISSGFPSNSSMEQLPTF